MGIIYYKQTNPSSLSAILDRGMWGLIKTNCSDIPLYFECQNYNYEEGATVAEW